MRTLVTGGAGFIGSHLSERLLAAGDAVCVLDDLSTGAFRNIAHLHDHPGFRFVAGSVLDRPLVRTLVEESDVVFHLAAAVGVRRILEQPRRSIEVNLRGTEHVLAAAARTRPRVLIASTSEVYGKNTWAPLREEDDSILGPTSITRWLYAFTKAADECLALAYARESALPVVLVRLFNTIGPRQTGQYGMVVPRFVQQALEGRPITVYGDGSQTRCFTYVDDVVRALQLLATHPAAPGEIFNVGQPHEVRIDALARLVRERTGSASPIVYVPYDEAYGAGFEDMQRRVPDTSKLLRLTGFSPRVSLDEALGHIISDLRHQRTERRAASAP
jgi:UDP-glucose 4-epimerase